MTVIKRKYYTVEEGAEILRISKCSMHRRLDSGAIKKRKVGNRILLTMEDIENAVVEVKS